MCNIGFNRPTLSLDTMPKDILFLIGRFISHPDARHMSVSCKSFRIHWLNAGLNMHPWLRVNTWCDGARCEYRIIAHMLEPMTVSRVKRWHFVRAVIRIVNFLLLLTAFVVIYISISLVCVILIGMSGVVYARHSALFMNVVGAIVGWFDVLQMNMIQPYICKCAHMSYTLESVLEGVASSRPNIPDRHYMEYSPKTCVLRKREGVHYGFIYTIMMISHCTFILYLIYYYMLCSPTFCWLLRVVLSRFCNICPIFE